LGLSLSLGRIFSGLLTENLQNGNMAVDEGIALTGLTRKIHQISTISFKSVAKARAQVQAGIRKVSWPMSGKWLKLWQSMANEISNH
jgi:hypothetical protein